MGGIQPERLVKRNATVNFGPVPITVPGAVPHRRGAP